MSAAEIIWRAGALFADIVDLIKVQVGVLPELPPAHFGRSQGLRLTNLQTGFAVTSQPDWLSELVSRADAIAANRLSFFNLVDVQLGTPVRWQKDRNTGVEAPLKPIQFVDYRNAMVFGDCKLVWEPNRHHHLVVLARAYKATGETRYADAVVAQMLDWIDQNPYGYGMNWRSPLELSVRMINWVWALDLIEDAGVIDKPIRRRVVECVWRHCHDVVRKYSQGTSANNHLVGEAAGVFVAASYFGFAHWIDDSRSILEREVSKQIFDDGCTREHAFGYQFFVLQFYYCASVVADRYGQPFSDDYFAAMKLMLRFQLLLGLDGDVPLVGDSDDGYVLDLGGLEDRVAVLAWINIGIDGDQGFHHLARRSESSTWMELDRPSGDYAMAPFESVAFQEAGYYLLRSEGGTSRVTVLFDCAELGYTSIAAHGHADALSCLVRIDGRDLFVEAGTYDYFTYPEWRNHFRSTKAHNTLEIDGLDQSVMAGPFMWDVHARAECQEWTTDGQGGLVVGSHDGYERLEDAVTHTRRVRLSGEDCLLEIVDELACAGDHDARLYFHLAPGWKVTGKTGNTLSCQQGDINVLIEFSASLNAETIYGDESSKLGWFSSAYHSRVPTTTLVAAGRVRGRTMLETRVSWK